MRARVAEPLPKESIVDDEVDDKNHNPSITPFSFVQTCRCCMPKFKLHSSTEVPPWMARPYIKEGYRPSLSPMQCIASLVYFHNESINIWSHLLGAILVIYLAFYEDNNDTDDLLYAPELFPHGTAVLRIFLLAAAGCLLASTAYHAGNCNGDKSCCDALLRVDATGVATLIAASFLPGVYFGFACYPDLRCTYLVVTGILLIVGVAVSLADTCASHLAHVEVGDDIESMNKKKEDPAAPKSVIEHIRVMTFVLSVCLGGAGIIQWTYLVPDESRAKILPGVIGMFVFYGIGFGFYISNFPERCSPGLFDYVLHSHQLWHACVVAAILVWYAACVQANVSIGENGCSAFIRLSDSIGTNLRASAR